jgi:glycosyltransferase involved in cell wall biosynthesis
MEDRSMRVSVVICTWNRADLLDQTLTQFTRLRIPPGVDWEVLVVNNRCTDATDQVLARHAAHLPLVRLYEPEAGKSFAANQAIDRSRGDLLLWTDDDVLVDPGWMEAYVQAAHAWPEATFFGGTVEALFVTRPPRWLRRNLSTFSSVYALIEPRPDGQPISRREVPPVGANLATRRSAFDQLRFNTLLGPCRNSRVVGEETQLIHDLQDAGHHGVWVGSSRVQHYTPPGRLTRKYIWEYFIGLGRTDARVLYGQEFPLLGGAPRWVVRKYVMARLAMHLWAPLAGPRWAQAYRQAAKMLGLMSEWRSMAAAEVVSANLAPAVETPPVGIAPVGALAAATGPIPEE